MTDGIQVLQDVVVFGVAVEGEAVVVDLYGSPANVCGTVRFDLPDLERHTAVDLLDHWSQADTALTLIAHGSAVALQNDHAVFAAQIAASDQ